MERGLLWLPLLALFIGLAWAGWREYRKVEAYQQWAEAFERAKYDLYAVLGQQGSELTWGKPTPNGPVDLQTLSLNQVQSIQLQLNQQVMDLPQDTEQDSFPTQGDRPTLVFNRRDNADPVLIPFTELPLALQWGQALQKDCDRLNLSAS